VPSLEPNRRELAVLRDKQIPGVLDEFIEAFSAGSRERGQQYLLAIRRFLGEPPPADAPWNYVGTLSPNTRASYAAALEEFFEWLAREHGAPVPPELVTSLDVERYVQWLMTPGYTLAVERLKDGDHPLRRLIYETVERLGSADLSSIYAALPRAAVEALDKEEPLGSLSKQLGRMVLHRNLVRSPTIDEIRRYVPLAGIRVFKLVVLPTGGFASPTDGDLPPDAQIMDMDDVFIYRVPDPKGVSRRTVVQKLAALSSFWETLRQGENVPGGGPILQHNVIAPVLKRVSRGMAQETKRAARARKPDPMAVLKLLRATDHPRTLAQYRNRALVLFLLFTGVRVEEAVSLRRGPPAGGTFRYAGWFEGGDPPMVRLLRKGGRQHVIPYPPMALEALVQFQTKLESVAAPMDGQAVDPKGSKYVPIDSPRWRYAELARRHDAPLFPSLYLWGANSYENYERYKPNVEIPPEKPMTARAVRYVLRSLAEKAGLSDQDVRSLHPHALRHFAAVAMFKEGKPLNEIQDMLGHESITTTERYIQELVTEIESSGQNEILRYLQQFEEPEEVIAGEPPVEPPKVIEVRGEPVKKPKPRKVPERPAKEPAPTPAERVAEAPPKPEAPQEAPQVAEIVDAVEEAAALPPAPLPENDIPVSPEPPEEKAEVVLTSAGPATEVDDRLIAIDGEPAKGVTPRMIGNKSSGSPDWAYEALADANREQAVRDLAAANAGLNRANEQRAPDTVKKDWRKKIAAAEKKLEQIPGLEAIQWTRTLPRFYSKGTKDRGANLVVEIEVIPATTKKAEQKKERVQSNEWLINHYHPWPRFYGIGEASLLPWFASGQASTRGFVTAGQVIVPPIPVLSPEQVDPQTQFGAKVLDCAEALYGEWIAGDPSKGIGPSPTRAFGIVRWYALLSFLTTSLQKYVADQKTKVQWQPWAAVCTLGKDVRAHEDEWVCAWLRENAHTYTTTYHAFEKLNQIQKEQGEEAFLEAFRMGTFQALTPFDALPEWMADDDPVNAIYQEDPKEWDKFVAWIGSVTGQQMSADRRKQRADAQRFVKKEVKVESEVLEGQLRDYYEAVDVARKGPGDPRTLPDGRQITYTKEEIDQAIEDRDMWAAVVLDRYGIDLNDPELRALKRQERIRTILSEAYPEGIVREVDDERSKNTLADSKLFDARYFRLDRKNHTIAHTDEFRREFFATYGQDSELAMRRAARAMWEYAKSEKRMAEGKLESWQYSKLYAMMLSYIAWVMPAGEEMERQIAERSPGAVMGGAARRRWLTQEAQVMRSLISTATPQNIQTTERLAGESDDEYRARILPLVRDRLPPEQREFVTLDNVEQTLGATSITMGFLAEQDVPGIDMERALVSEVAGTEAGGDVFAPEVGRAERKKFKEEKEKAQTEAPPVKRMAEMTDEELEERGFVRLPDGDVIPMEPHIQNYHVPSRSQPGLVGYHIPNGERPVKLGHQDVVRCTRHIRNAGMVLPSPFSMIRAMSQLPGERGLFARLFG